MNDIFRRSAGSLFSVWAIARPRTCIYLKASLSVEIRQLRLLGNPD